MTSDTNPTASASPLRTSLPALMTAALAGLMGFTSAACGDGKGKGESSKGGDKVVGNSCPVDASIAGGERTMDAGVPADAGPDAMAALDASDSLPKVTKEVPGVLTYDSLKQRCDELDGYVQVHAACGGSNSCKGFSYGDWGADSVLTEHTCASLNGCNGLSCVVLPPDSGKSGEEVYKADLAPGGPQSCLNCHAVWNETADGSEVDATKFKVWVLPGSARTAANWLDGVSAENQELAVAFGRFNILANGIPVRSMVGYHKLFSRAETQRVVAHLRTLTPVIEEMKPPQ